MNASTAEHRAGLELERGVSVVVPKDYLNIPVAEGTVSLLVNSDILSKDLSDHRTDQLSTTFTLPVYFGARDMATVLNEIQAVPQTNKQSLEAASLYLSIVTAGGFQGGFLPIPGKELIYVNMDARLKKARKLPIWHDDREQALKITLSELWIHEGTHVAQSLDPERRKLMEIDNQREKKFRIVGKGVGSLLGSAPATIRLSNEIDQVVKRRQLTRRDFLKLSAVSSLAVGSAVSGNILGDAFSFSLHYDLFDKSEDEAFLAAEDKQRLNNILPAFSVKIN